MSVDADPIYIHDGKYWTSAGVTAGIDLALALVQDDLGVEVAQTVARWLVMFLHRPGGQTQFASPVWVRRAERSTVRAVQTLVESAPGGDHRVPAMAAAAAMSVRHFTRVFTAEVGETPGKFVERVRLEAARIELETTNDTLDLIAARCGFGTAESLRRVTQRRLGVAPDAYRRRFRTGRRRKDTRMTTGLQVAIPLFDEFTALDGVGPYEVLQRIPSIDVTFLGHRRGEFRSENGMLGLTADATFADIPEPDVIVFPGGVGTRPITGRRRGPRLGPTRPRHDPVHHVGLHRLTGARRCRSPRRTSPRRRTGRVTPSWRSTGRFPRHSGWSSTSTTGSSRRPASRAVSTWPCVWSSSSSIARRPKQRN